MELKIITGVDLNFFCSVLVILILGYQVTKTGCTRYVPGLLTINTYQLYEA